MTLEISLFLLGFLPSIACAQYPDPKLTPGVADKTITWNELCLHSTKERRLVTKQTKLKVCARYKVQCDPTKYEVDHFIPICSAGKNDLANLWPQPYEPRPGAHEKDQTETWLCSQICQKKVSIERAQELLRNDWVSAYQLMKKEKATREPIRQRHYRSKG